MKKQLSLFVLILVLFSAIGFSFHHHDDGKHHDDCTVCIASNHTPTVSDSGANLFYREIVLPFEAPEKGFYLPLPDEVSSPSRAPPTS